MFLPTRTKCVYPNSIQIPALGFHKLSESLFYNPLAVEVCSLQNVVKMLEDIVEGWCTRVNVAGETTFGFIELLKGSTCDIRSGFLVEENWPCGWLRPAAGGTLLGASPLLSTLLTYNDVASGRDWQQTTKECPRPLSGAGLAVEDALP